MSVNSQWDSDQPVSLELGYNRIERELSDLPRFISGQNMYVTTGGKPSRRPGTLPMLNGNFNLRVDRIWIVETIDPTPYVYLVVSAYNPSTGFWEVWHQPLTSAPPPLTQSGTYRDMNQSTRAHEAILARGLLFIKGFPAATNAEKLGSVIFNGTGGTVTIQPWGALGPSVPAALAATQVTTLNAAISNSATSLVINAITAGGSLPSTPFVAQIDYEQVDVTNVSGTTWTITRAFNGTVATSHEANATIIVRNWSASNHLITVNQFWGYSYAWISITGQYTDRAPAQTNPDLLPSQTGPFFNQQPQITVQGLADTTNFPSIAIYRTTDGGGTFYLLTTITNTGVGSITYTDNSLTSGASSNVNADPLPDTILTTQAIATNLDSNSPPPTVTSPGIVGTSAPQPSTPFAYFQGRIWYGIGNILFFSAQEEITLGVPEESWPSGLTGNFFRLQSPIVNVSVTLEGLYVFTYDMTYILTGTNLQTFSIAPIFDNYGAPPGNPRAITSFADMIALMTHDYRIALISQGNIVPISDFLSTDLINQINNGGTFDIKYYANTEIEWLVVTGHVDASPDGTLNDGNGSQQWVYDVKRSNRLTLQQGIYAPRQNFWYVPWNFPSTAMASGRLSPTSSERYLIFYSWNPTTAVGQFAYLDPTGETSTDYTFNGVSNFNIGVTLNLSPVPTGDHINAKREPGVTPVLYSVVLERTLFSGDTDPDFYYYIDDIWTTPFSCNAVDPARRKLSIGYKTMEYMIYQVGQRFAFSLAKLNSADQFEIQNFFLKFSPESGA